jgi:hypothetical protein
MSFGGSETQSFDPRPAQQGHHVFCVGAFGEPGEAAQVIEQRSYLPAMVFNLLL